MRCRGVRGATTVESNSREEILQATRELLALIVRLNEICTHDLGSAFFTTTTDIDAEFPALAARQLGWSDVPLMCGHEMSVPGALPMTIRVMLHWNTEKDPKEIKHVYIKGASKLRPDQTDIPEIDQAELEEWIKEQVEIASQAANN